MYTSRYRGAPYSFRDTHQNRVELNVLKLDADGNSVYDDDIDPDICRCFPRTSQKTIPSMLYDHINCPHVEHRHIQPAQQYVFTYPWSASSGNGRQRARRDFDQESGLSVIGEDDDEWQNNVTRTAPPFATHSPAPARAPYSAPVPAENIPQGKYRPIQGTDFRQFGSAPSLTGFSAKRQTHVANRKSNIQQAEPSTPFIDKRERGGGIQDKPRHFQGHYMDQKDGRVYNFNVKYGKRDIQATREHDNTYR
ncbi:uncharacterized protein LOC110465437 [Mizuhopecten yessoensis]|uniref:uncharacterized protein LOC110465437 n=1 Tax=Mizuhopecten yessoensis TaxID=6573 RepID=UPI000B45E6FA|nr:uncharacterized protein LOC110465437 [Mizuhopecten yessoensis]XP_021376915.1 uncharacterized protein LOC110465437 [Mizuhopecten yessoensis]